MNVICIIAIEKILITSTAKSIWPNLRPLSPLGTETPISSLLLKNDYPLSFADKNP